MQYFYNDRTEQYQSSKSTSDLPSCLELELPWAEENEKEHCLNYTINNGA